MLTAYERNLANYWANWKPGMGPYGKHYEDTEIKLDVRVEQDRFLVDDLIDEMMDII